MARVPTVQGNAVQLAPQPRERLRAYDATGGLDAVGRGLRDLAQTGGAIAEQQDQLDAQLDNAGAKTLDVEARQRIDAVLSDYASKTGLNAGTARPDVERQLGELRTTFASRATTPRMARMLNDALEVQFGEALGKVQSHATREIAGAERLATQARAGSLLEAATAASWRRGWRASTRWCCPAATSRSASSRSRRPRRGRRWWPRVRAGWARSRVWAS